MVINDFLNQIVFKFALPDHRNEDLDQSGNEQLFITSFICLHPWIKNSYLQSVKTQRYFQSRLKQCSWT